MKRIITECHRFLKNFEYTYAFCGGHALELFTGKINRTHSDVDITLFNEDRKSIIAYILDNGWNVYEPLHSANSLRLITDPNDEGTQNRLYIWAIKPDCSFMKIEPKPDNDTIFSYEILDDEQVKFDFIDVIFNTQKGGKFVCDSNGSIARELDKAILYHGDIPYLAPEIILFFIANPAYIESDYHREKNNSDWKFTPPFLTGESKEWLIDALRKIYPEGNQRLEELLAL